MPKTETKGKQVAEMLSNFINSATQQDKKDFVDAMMVEHRTLQQDVFLLFLQTCDAWSEMKEQDRYDARNEFTVNTSCKIKDLVDNL